LTPVPPCNKLAIDPADNKRPFTLRRSYGKIVVEIPLRSDDMPNKKVTFVIDPTIDKKLTLIKEIDKRSIQKEIEWLIEKRYEEVKKCEVS
jgi:hypothetical protein